MRNHLETFSMEDQIMDYGKNKRFFNLNIFPHKTPPFENANCCNVSNSNKI